jgi:hypothetical protein
MDSELLRELFLVNRRLESVKDTMELEDSLQVMVQSTWALLDSYLTLRVASGGRLLIAQYAQHVLDYVAEVVSLVVDFTMREDVMNVKMISKNFNFWVSKQIWRSVQIVEGDNGEVFVNSMRLNKNLSFSQS